MWKHPFAYSAIYLPSSRSRQRSLYQNELCLHRDTGINNDFDKLKQGRNIHCGTNWANKMKRIFLSSAGIQNRFSYSKEPVPRLFCLRFPTAALILDTTVPVLLLVANISSKVLRPHWLNFTEFNGSHKHLLTGFNKKCCMISTCHFYKSKIIDYESYLT